MASTLDYLRTQKRDEILTLARKYGIRNVRIFGSVARGDDTPESDVDFLISLDPNRRLFESFSFQIELEQLLQRKVDVILDESLRPYTKPGIVAEATPL
jgi:uncharacterized protein